MKTIKKLFFLLVSICLLVNCSETDYFWGDDVSDSELKCTGNTVSVPFKTNPFDYTYLYAGPAEACGEDQPLQVIAEGSGTATHLGNFTTHVEFCCNIETFNPDHLVIGSFVAANGDELFISTWGQTGPPNQDDPPEIVARWEADFIFAGGTGRFEGATGEGIYYGYNYLVDGVPNGMLCKAEYVGVLTLEKGNQWRRKTTPVKPFERRKRKGQ